MRKILLLVFIFSIIITFAWGDGIIITSPKAGAAWQIGTKPVISWTSSGVTGNVKIRLFNSAGVKLLIIADNVSNNNGGSYVKLENKREKHANN